MAFKSKTPGKGLTRKSELKTKAPLSSQGGLTSRSAAPKLPSPLDEKKALQKRTLRALERAKKTAAEAGVDLSEWESDFIDSVSDRVKTYGRAFADPDKGAINGTLSLLQGVKLREIRQKVKSRAAKNADDEN
ncbi:hypothetical protein [Asticcacaulis excentricus]|uniref:Uncharacterized protein n=1 Tax=Asticcacaulis excentricus (strain ATCC 15261 / DSM 4724 / KCTC 12464 / NCIMB 9791 / VKM B-1370 / CB 48) TaxID=573065 RepID=E8RQB1_ASTEC|nr:hypothetical protein [Asticcacaulis excentricus]ADU13213.1 hypothetical protein Astex_1547 [Asticcacaulis excentricus CB 48]